MVATIAFTLRFDKIMHETIEESGTQAPGATTVLCALIAGVMWPVYWAAMGAYAFRVATAWVRWKLDLRRARKARRRYRAASFLTRGRQARERSKGSR